MTRRVTYRNTLVAISRPMSVQPVILFIDRGVGQTDSSCYSKGGLGSFRRKLGAEWCDAARILRGELFESFCRYLNCILTATFITRL
jgi:hypothetical protein